MLYAYLKFFGGIVASHTSATNMGTDWRDNDPQMEPVVEIYQGDRQNYEMPDALDLLVFCAEAGLSLDQAIEQVAQDLRSSSPDVAGEFAAAAAEMRVLPDRSKALENLAQRAGLASHHDANV